MNTGYAIAAGLVLASFTLTLMGHSVAGIFLALSASIVLLDAYWTSDSAKADARRRNPSRRERRGRVR